MDDDHHALTLKWLGINTYKEAVIYMREDCHVCRAEGFEAQARIQVRLGEHTIIATLNIVGPELLDFEEASLSIYAWELLNAKEGEKIHLSHPRLLKSLGFIRAKMYGHELKERELGEIVNDTVAGFLSDVQLSAFLSACSGGHLNKHEIRHLTTAMVASGNRLTWPTECVVDKHGVGGLPGNRTSLIIVPIVTAFGLTMPKTSSRAITSPAGTADTMAVLAPVEMDISHLRKVVEQENGCIVWGGGMGLSPADDILIRIEKVLDIDSEGQLVASILSKKLAAGSTHVVIDMPVGPTAKVRTPEMANLLKTYLESIGYDLGMKIKVILSEGIEPVGRGIGPVLEAQDILAVLQNDKNAPQDLRERALTLAGIILEFSESVKEGTGKQLAQTILDSGQAWQKFQAICHAQGGLFEPIKAKYSYEMLSSKAGMIKRIDNRRLARLAKLAGAPNSKAAGVELLSHLGKSVEKEQPLFILYAETKGELNYALTFLQQEKNIIQVDKA